MIDGITDLAQALRASGVRVSTGEVIDAARAVDVIGLRDPDVVREALAASLIKQGRDRALFDQIFDLTFAGGAARAARLVPLDELLRHAGFDDATRARLLDLLAIELAGLSPVARAALGLGTAAMPDLLRRAASQVELGRMATPLAAGFFSHRMFEAMELASAGRELDELAARLAQLAALSPAEGADLAGVVEHGLQGVRQVVRDYVADEGQRRTAAARGSAAARALRNKPLAALTEREVIELRGEVARLARLLRARIQVRPVAPHRGRLDLRRTLRRSLATSGIPFDLRRRERRPHRPRLVVLCDVSDSVRNVSRFLLELVYALQAEFERVSSFAFVADLGELTELFRQNKADRAIELAITGEAVNVFANSNYGRALTAFTQRHLGLVTRRTTVLIIGDGRNNYHPPRAEALATIHRRARQVLWLNPEPPPAWGFGDSAMRDYAPHCDRVAVARDLDGLRRVVDDLIAPGRRRHRSPHP